MNAFTIREAKREDCPNILKLVKELADFENLLEQSKLTLNDLQRDGFDCQQPLFHCIVAEANDSSGTIVGYALYFFAYSTWCGKTVHLEDFFVPERYRKHGIGSALIAAVAKKATENACSRMDFVVLDWNPAMHFYKSHGAEDLTHAEGWHMLCIQDKALVSLANKDNEINGKLHS